MTPFQALEEIDHVARSAAQGSRNRGQIRRCDIFHGWWPPSCRWRPRFMPSRGFLRRAKAASRSRTRTTTSSATTTSRACNTNGATHAKALITELDLGSPTTSAHHYAPFIASKYTGPDQYIVGNFDVTKGPLDDRTYHGAIQDLHIEGRRLFSAGPVAIAPLVGVTIPTHDYETRRSRPGRHRRELQSGATAGADLNRLLPGTYVHGRYALASPDASRVLLRQEQHRGRRRLRRHVRSSTSTA